MHGDSLLKTRDSLLSHMKQGHDAAWAEFVKDYKHLIYRFCRSHGLSNDDAEDVTQNVFLRLYRFLEQYERAQGKFRFWLGAITLNAVRDFQRQRQRARMGGGSDETERLLNNLEARAELMEQLAEQFDQELLQQVLRKITPRFEEKTMQAFYLQTRDGLSGKETAGRLGVSLSTVSAYKCRVIQALRDELLRLTESEED